MAGVTNGDHLPTKADKAAAGNTHADTLPAVPNGFGVSTQVLRELNEHKDAAVVEKLGGTEGLAKALASDPTTGIDAEAAGSHSLDARREVFGRNAFRQRPAKMWIALLFEALKDPTLIMLMLAAAVSIALGIAVKEEREQQAWSEGVAILVAVMVVSFVGATNDYQKDKQFRSLNSQKDVFKVTVVRSGKKLQVVNTEVVVGDVLVLETGDKVVADGLALEVHGLVVDEASLTGESEPVKKKLDEDPWIRSGTQVTEGSGRMLILAVGESSEWGKTMLLVQTESGDTPLQEKLGGLAIAIGKFGLAVASICFVVLLVRWIIANKGFPANKIASGPLEYFIFAITIVVVAVPEGLPLAVTISLAYSMKKMMKDNNFVRVLAACETMGGATAICSDKTGTLTENRMTVVEGWFAGQLWQQLPAVGDLPAHLVQLITDNVALNSKAFVVEEPGKKPEFVGNRTECALLQMTKNWGTSYQAVADMRLARHDEVEKLYGFSSAKKMASVLLRMPGGSLRLYNKGASEIVLQRCVKVYEASGEAVPMTPAKLEALLAEVTAMADRGLRTLCLAVRDFTPQDVAAQPAGFFEQPPDDQLTCCCLVGIKDPVRKEVPAAVATCQRAGIFVRMVTGDNIHTAKSIARECGILTPDGLALEGPDFRKMTPEQLAPLLPRLQVLARSSPTDKYTLVQALKRAGDVVAVTGDGTNDAPALKESDVGLAMGIAGTEVAKEAADIVILDDNFSSIVKSVLWGRCVFSNIRKFLQFQLTINFVALVVAFVSAVTTGTMPLNVLQLLWVNLIMDSLAALALATEAPVDTLLLNKPHGRDQPLINRKMWKHIISQGLYQMFWLFLIIYGLPVHGSAKYHLRPACDAFSAVDLQSPDRITLSNVTLAPGQRYVNTCCQANNGTLPCLQSAGGVYLPGEPPLCTISFSSTGEQRCSRREPKGGDYAAFCGSNSKCARWDDFHKLYERGEKGYEDDLEEDRRHSNSIVFNAFIFMQVFNELNARKIQDEYNVFDGLFKSKIFFYVLLITVGAQVIIMQTPVNGFFKVNSQDWGEWLFAIGIGFGAIPFALAVKLISRAMGSQGAPQLPPPKPSVDAPTAMQQV